MSVRVKGEYNKTPFRKEDSEIKCRQMVRRSLMTPRLKNIRNLAPIKQQRRRIVQKRDVSSSLRTYRLKPRVGNSLQHNTLVAVKIKPK